MRLPSNPPSPIQDLPPIPPIVLDVARDRSAEARATGGFLDVRRLELVARYPDGSASAPFPYDVAHRAALDAVIIVAHFVGRSAPSAGREAPGGPGGAPVRQVYLRSAVRPPCALRPIAPHHDGLLWELPAGLIEPGEEAAEAAARELGEELGFVVEARALRPLGEWTFPAPGMIGERHVFFEVEVDPARRLTPTEDGSALERGASIAAVALDDAIALCRRGVIRDAKTELGLRRLAEVSQ